MTNSSITTAATDLDLVAAAQQRWDEIMDARPMSCAVSVDWLVVLRDSLAE